MGECTQLLIVFLFCFICLINENVGQILKREDLLLNATEATNRCLDDRVIQSSSYFYFEANGTASVANGLYRRQGNATTCDYGCSHVGDDYYYGTYIYYNEDTDYYMYEVWIPGVDNGLTLIYVSEEGGCDLSNPLLRGSLQLSAMEQNGAHIWMQEPGNEIIWSYNSDQSSVDVEEICDPVFGFPQPCDTMKPTMMPTGEPVRAPTFVPTEPSIEPSSIPTSLPTAPTDSPTEAPSQAPTSRPTHLPTVTTGEFAAENCTGLFVQYLENAFPEDESDTRFTQVGGNFTYNGRSVWTNDFGVTIYFSTRFDNRHWVISNGSYTLLREDYTNSTLPGQGYVSYDHFPNDNIHAASFQPYTLFFDCFQTQFPTEIPSPSPTNEPSSPEPTGMPVAPTEAPVVPCVGLKLQVSDISCDDSITGSEYSRFGKNFQQQGQKFNNKYWWRGIQQTTGDYIIYYNEVFDEWVVDSPTEWALVHEDDDNSYVGSYPPNGDTWILKKSTDSYYPGCYVSVEYTCTATGYPTRNPTPRSENEDETTITPTDSPTLNPTGSPTIPPTTAPTHAPTIGPTSAPVSDCFGLTLEGAFNETGKYNQANTTRNDRFWWFNIYSNAIIFYSPSVLHETWVLLSSDGSDYFLSQTIPPDQPPSGLWDYYLGASPFVEEVVELDITCFVERFETPRPSLSPSSIPTAMPVATSEPTAAPIECDFVFVSVYENGTELEFEGDFSQDNISISDEGKLSWTNRDDSSIVIFYRAPFWYLGSVDTSDDTSLIINYDNYKPPDSATWQVNEIEIIPETTEESSNSANMSSTMIPDTPYETNIIGDFVWVDFDCSASYIPTIIPSNIPSTVPTYAPTNPCLSLQLETDADFAYEGFFYKQSYDLNGRDWFKSSHLGAIIAYDGGDNYWYLATEPNQNLILIQNISSTGGSEYYPPSGSYFIAYTSDTIEVSMTCYHTPAPSMDPTEVPTALPTTNDRPYWMSCANDTYYVELIEKGATTWNVYWDEPTAGDSSGNDVTITSDSYTSGVADLAPGEYVITYTATDDAGLTAIDTCEVTVFVLGNAPSDTYQTCLDDDFSIAMAVNSSYYIIENEASIIIDSSDYYLAQVSNAELADSEQNCFVQLTYVSAYSPTSESDSSSSISGTLNKFDYWEIVIMFLAFWLIVLTIVVIRCICLRKQQVVLDSQALLSQTAQEAGDASIYAGIADNQMMRKATLTGTANVRGGVSPLAAPAPAPGAAGAKQDDAKMGDIELGAMTPGQGLGEEEVVVPTGQAFWQRELDYLGAKGYVNEKKSLDLLIINAVKFAGKVDKGATATKVEKILDKEREETLKANAAKHKVQKAWDNQGKDELNAPQAAIAPPTMSSLADSSNVLMEDEDEELFSNMMNDNRKGSYMGDLPDPANQGAPPAPVPPPMGGPAANGNGQRPKREDIGQPRESTHLDL